MARYVPKKQKKAPKVIHPDLNGSLKGRTVTLTHNRASDRYVLRVGTQLLCSSFHNICLRKAEDEGVKWQKKDA